MPSDPRVILGYAVLYLVWGSTYLAMRIAAESLPPFLLASARFLVAGVILLVLSVARGEGIRPAREWGRAAIVALFLLVGGNGSVTWAVQHVPSGVAALLVATTPLWLALFSGEKISARLVVGLLLGLCGIGILVGPGALGDKPIDAVGAAVLVLASISWAIGSVVQRGAHATSATAGTGMQMLHGALMLLIISASAGEQLHAAEVTGRSLAALAYLTVAGSLVGFTTYAWLMKTEPASRVATYAYVNPVVAVILGALVGGESVTPRVVVAAVVIIVGVVVILRGKKPVPA